ncbi:MAG: cytochrome P450, partial [Candidatus Rokuibacteriota bacterium]
MNAKTLPRGPKGHFLLGSLPDFRRDQLDFYASCAREYGDVVPVRLGPRRVMLLYHPDAIEEMLVTRSRDFIKSPGVRLLRPLLGDGLLLSEGDSWLRQRRLVQPAFHRQRLAAYSEVMTAYAERRLAGWKDGQVLDVHAEMMALTQAIVTKTLFDADVSEEGHVIGHASHVLMEAFGARLRSMIRLPRWVPTPANLKSGRAIRRLDQVVYRIIANRRRNAEDRGDLLSILLHAQDADDGTRMTNQQVRDEVMTLFMAGHETTAVALSWTWYLLAQHPDVDARLAAELRIVLG